MAPRPLQNRLRNQLGNLRTMNPIDLFAYRRLLDMPPLILTLLIVLHETHQPIFAWLAIVAAFWMQERSRLGV